MGSIPTASVITIVRPRRSRRHGAPVEMDREGKRNTTIVVRQTGLRSPGGSGVLGMETSTTDKSTTLSRRGRALIKTGTARTGSRRENTPHRIGETTRMPFRVAVRHSRRGGGGWGSAGCEAIKPLSILGSKVASHCLSVLTPPATAPPHA